MKINWFPGHMKKALEEIKRELKKVDVVIYVLDSRAPKSCLNPELDKISGQKPVLYVFNKVDIADEEKISKFSRSFKTQTSDYIIINSTTTGAGKLITSKIRMLCQEKINKFRQKGINPTIRGIVVGVPNCGKSTLVNNLCQKGKAVTGNKPGVTKGQTWFNIGDCVEVCDTPGTLYPNLINQEIAQNLAFIGSIKDEIVETNALATELIKRLKAFYPNNFEGRYGKANTLEDIAKSRGFLMQGGELDIEKAAFAILNDFRSGKFGRVTIEELWKSLIE